MTVLMMMMMIIQMVTDGSFDDIDMRHAAGVHNDDVGDNDYKDDCEVKEDQYVDKKID